MSSLEDRLRDALAPEYRVERELAHGASAIVYLATDVALDRTVAIKVLRPELATARGARRFLREARLLAQVAHPNIVPVHRAGEAGGLSFYVMDHVGGQSLRTCLERGRPPAERCIAIGRSVLGALEAVHAAGIVHRDVKPENILLPGGHALLADFGIARPSGDGPESPTDSGALGTPGYMAPEQAEGGEPTASADLYAVAMVLYECLTGRKWRLAVPVDEADWSGIAVPVASVLRRALAPSPGDRWPDAAAFRVALAAAAGGKGPGRRRRGAIAGIALLVLAGIAGLVLLRHETRGTDAADRTLADLAVLPCVPASVGDSALARSVARIATLDLQGIPHLRTRSSFTSFRWWTRPGEHRARDPSATGLAPAALHVRRVVSCVLARPARDTLEARLELVSAGGGSLPVPGPIRGPALDPPQALGDSVAVALLGRLGRTLSSGGISVFGGLHVQAVAAFLRGEDAFEAGDWERADSSYDAALAIQPDFPLARWRLADVHRWQLAPTDVDLERLQGDGASGLGPLDRRLLAARLAPPGPAQFARYRDILRDYPHDAYATLLFADELFHRGPLWGIPVDSAETVLELAVARDSFLQPAWEHLAEVRIRLGKRREAAEAVRRLRSLDAASPGGSSVMTRVQAQAWRERFAPDSVAAGRRHLLGRRPDVVFLMRWSRLPGPTLDLDRTELELGAALVASAGARSRARLSGHVAQGLALMAAGRPSEALAHLDSAAALSGDDRGRVEASAWRVVPASLGFPGVPEEHVRAARARLRELAGSPSTESSPRRQAAWALALDAYGRLDLRVGDRWAAVVGSPGTDSVGGRLALVLAAARRAAQGDLDSALRISEPVLAYDSAADLEAPFARAALHLLRADWQARTNRPAAALASLTWQENSDFEGAPGAVAYASPLVQAGEVDWALGTVGRLLGAEAALEADRPRRACRYAREVLRMWSRPDPAYERDVAEARALEARSCAR